MNIGESIDKYDLFLSNGDICNIYLDIPGQDIKILVGIQESEKEGYATTTFGLNIYNHDDFMMLYLDFPSVDSSICIPVNFNDYNGPEDVKRFEPRTGELIFFDEDLRIILESRQFEIDDSFKGTLKNIINEQSYNKKLSEEDYIESVSEYFDSLEEERNMKEMLRNADYFRVFPSAPRLLH